MCGCVIFYCICWKKEMFANMFYIRIRTRTHKYGSFVAVSFALSLNQLIPHSFPSIHLCCCVADWALWFNVFKKKDHALYPHTNESRSSNGKKSIATLYTFETEQVNKRSREWMNERVRERETDSDILDHRFKVNQIMAFFLHMAHVSCRKKQRAILFEMLKFNGPWMACKLVSRWWTFNFVNACDTTTTIRIYKQFNQYFDIK